MVQRGRGPAADTRERLIAGTLDSLRRNGKEGTTVAAIARASGLSRPTLYAHFGQLDDLIHEAIEQATLALADRISAEIGRTSSAASAIIEFIVLARREFRADPVTAMVIEISTAPTRQEGGTISPRMMRLARDLLGSSTTRHGTIDIDNDMVEAVVRTLLSVLTYTSENTDSAEDLRRYLNRVLTPVITAVPNSTNSVSP
jgi:AcrR family transcriptional regulator